MKVWVYYRFIVICLFFGGYVSTYSTAANKMPEEYEFNSDDSESNWIHNQIKFLEKMGTLVQLMGKVNDIVESPSARQVRPIFGEFEVMIDLYEEFVKVETGFSKKNLGEHSENKTFICAKSILERSFQVFVAHKEGFPRPSIDGALLLQKSKKEFEKQKKIAKALHGVIKAKIDPVVWERDVLWFYSKEKMTDKYITSADSVKNIYAIMLRIMSVFLQDLTNRENLVLVENFPKPNIVEVSTERGNSIQAMLQDEITEEIRFYSPKEWKEIYSREYLACHALFSHIFSEIYEKLIFSLQTRGARIQEENLRYLLEECAKEVDEVAKIKNSVSPLPDECAFEEESEEAEESAIEERYEAERESSVAEVSEVVASSESIARNLSEESWIPADHIDFSWREKSRVRGEKTVDMIFESCHMGMRKQLAVTIVSSLSPRFLKKSNLIKIPSDITCPPMGVCVRTYESDEERWKQKDPLHQMPLILDSDLWIYGAYKDLTKDKKLGKFTYCILVLPIVKMQWTIKRGQRELFCYAFDQTDQEPYQLEACFVGAFPSKQGMYFGHRFHHFVRPSGVK